MNILLCKNLFLFLIETIFFILIIKKANRCMTAICYSVMTFAIIAAILFISFIFLRTADIPLTILTAKLENNL